MKIEIWSDVMCPFCYMGSVQLDRAISEYVARYPEQKEELSIEWRSFFLNEDLKTDTSIDLFDSLSQEKGWSRQEAINSSEYVKNMGDPLGVVFNFDKVVVANTTKSHQMIQFAKTKELASDIKKALFRAYFQDGKNIDDREVLREIGASCGLEMDEIDDVLSENKYMTEIREDIELSKQARVSGVPFFVFDRRVAVSGAKGTKTLFSTMVELKKIKEEEARRGITRN